MQPLTITITTATGKHITLSADATRNRLALGV